METTIILGLHKDNALLHRSFTSAAELRLTPCWDPHVTIPAGTTEAQISIQISHARNLRSNVDGLLHRGSTNVQRHISSTAHTNTNACAGHVQYGPMKSSKSSLKKTRKCQDMRELPTHMWKFPKIGES